MSISHAINANYNLPLVNSEKPRERLEVISIHVNLAWLNTTISTKTELGKRNKPTISKTARGLLPNQFSGKKITPKRSLEKTLHGLTSILRND